MCVGSNMKVATHTTKATSPRSKLSYKRLLVLKLLAHYKKEEIKESKIQTGYWYIDFTQEQGKKCGLSRSPHLFEW